MSDLFPVAGARIYIGDATATQTADFVAGDFSAVTWVEIDGWETMGGIGDTSEVITTQLINRGRDVKQKGTRNAGSMENNFAILPTDAGQIAAIAAEKTNLNYAFRIVFDDAPASGPSPTGTTLYWVGLVTSANETGGGANTVRMFQVNIENNSNIVNVAAADGS